MSCLDKSKKYKEGKIFFGKIFDFFCPNAKCFIPNAIFFFVLFNVIFPAYVWPCLLKIHFVNAFSQNFIERKEGSLKQCDENQFISYFNKDEKCINWIRLNDNFIFEDSKENIVRPRLTNNFSAGRSIFLDKSSTIPNFETSLNFVPMSDNKVNVAINYGKLWRVIIGNGDYNQIVLQKNKSFPKENLNSGDWENIREKSGKKWIRPNSGLEPKNAIEVIIRSRPVPETNIIDVNLLIYGFLKDENKKERFEYNYELKVNNVSSSYSEMIGVELLDPNHENIQTQLKEFKLNKL